MVCLYWQLCIIVKFRLTNVFVKAAAKNYTSLQSK